MLENAIRTFFAYRLAVLADAVSHSVAQLYEERFGLGRNEWRVLAAIADLERTTARDVAVYSTLDKMQVSRALAALEARQLVMRAEGRADRRTKSLVLTGAGRALYREIVPLVIAQQEKLLAVLTPEQRGVLDGAIDSLLSAARRENVANRDA